MLTEQNGDMSEDESVSSGEDEDNISEPETESEIDSPVKVTYEKIFCSEASCEFYLAVLGFLVHSAAGGINVGHPLVATCLPTVEFDLTSGSRRTLT